MSIKRDEEDIENLKNVLDAARKKSYPTNLNNLGPLFYMSTCIEGLKVIFLNYLVRLNQ